MTSTQGLFGLFVQHAIAFLIPPRLERRRCSAPLRASPSKSGEPHYLSLGIAIGLAQTFYPQHSTVGPHDAERAVKGVLRFRVLDLVGEFDHLRAVVLVHTTQPCFKRGRLFRCKTV